VGGYAHELVEGARVSRWLTACRLARALARDYDCVARDDADMLRLEGASSIA